MEENTISVIIPVYNGERTIQRALLSCMQNKEWIHEIIIVNDHSTDSTIDEIEPFKQYLPIKIINNTGNHNPGMARKVGLLNATGKWIFFLDADDCLVTTSFKYCVDGLNNYDKNGNMLMLSPLRILYLFGTFKISTIDFHQSCCVGNFYKREYLINNEIFPNEELRLAEDSYYGERILYHIAYVDHREDDIAFYESPVYEVHSDYPDSFSLSNWVDFCIKYRFEKQRLLIEEFITHTYLLVPITEEYIRNFISCYFLYLCLQESVDIDQNKVQEQLQYFKESLKFFETSLKGSKEKILEYYHRDLEAVDHAFANAQLSTDTKITKPWSFEEFINQL